MKRKILAITTLLVAITGIVIVVVPFANSMKPSEKAKNARSQHDISNLGAGSFLFERFQRDAAMNEKVLIIRDWSGVIYSYLVPTQNGKVLMPERFWGINHYECNDFRPELDEKDKVLKDGKITCHDADTPGWGIEAWKWSYDGQSSYPWIADMYAPGFEVDSGILYVNR